MSEDRAWKGDVAYIKWQEGGGMAGQCRENNDQDPYPDSYGLTSVS